MYTIIAKPSVKNAMIKNLNLKPHRSLIPKLSQMIFRGSFDINKV